MSGAARSELQRTQASCYTSQGWLPSWLKSAADHRLSTELHPSCTRERRSLCWLLTLAAWLQLWKALDGDCVLVARMPSQAVLHACIVAGATAPASSRQAN
jgi:hypothetical protein